MTLVGLIYLCIDICTYIVYSRSPINIILLIRMQCTFCNVLRFHALVLWSERKHTSNVDDNNIFLYTSSSIWNVALEVSLTLAKRGIQTYSFRKSQNGPMQGYKVECNYGESDWEKVDFCITTTFVESLQCLKKKLFNTLTNIRTLQNNTK